MVKVVNRLDKIEEKIMSGLKDFQQATVNRIDYLYRHEQRRVLVSDEVGLGKTLIARGVIAKLAKLQGAEINEAKKILAFEATKLCRGEEEARKAEATAKETFENGGMGQDLPTFDMVNDINIVDALVATSLCKSKSDARRMIMANAISVNDQKITDVAFVINKDLAKDDKILLSSGKKNKVVLKLK